MTPHKAGGRGTFILDRVTRVGRIAVASGTRHAPTFRRLNEMLTTLNETGRSDILRQIRDGLSPLTVYESFRANELHKLPTSDEMKPLKGEMEAWLEEVECGVRQKAAHKTMVTHLGSGTVVDLPTRLIEYRALCKKARTPAQFNRVKMSTLSFVRDTLKRSHRIYGEVQDVPPMREKKSPERHILSWGQVEEKAEMMTDMRDRLAVYGMWLTGMGPTEWYLNGWEERHDRVVVFGEKRKGRARSVPAVRTEYFSRAKPMADCKPLREMRRFGERLYATCGIHTYDLRRSYANFLEAAGITRTRRKLYMGHRSGDVTDIYEQHEVDEFLAPDAEHLEAFLARSPITTPITKLRGKHA